MFVIPSFTTSAGADLARAGFLTAVLAARFLVAGPVLALDVSGPQSGVWSQQDSPVVLTAAVSVSAGTTLTIEAGVEVRGGDMVQKIRIDGELRVAGPGVTFHNAQLSFRPGSTGFVTGADFVANQFQFFITPLIDVRGSSPRIADCSFDHVSQNRGTIGIRIFPNTGASAPITAPEIRRCFFRMPDAQDVGIVFETSQGHPVEGTVADCTFEDCTTALQLSDSTGARLAPEIRDIRIHYTQDLTRTVAVRLDAGESCAATLRGLDISLTDSRAVSFAADANILAAPDFVLEGVRYSSPLADRNQPILRGTLATTRPVTFTGSFAGSSRAELQDVSLASGTELTIGAGPGVRVGRMIVGRGAKIRFARDSRTEIDQLSAGFESLTIFEPRSQLEGRLADPGSVSVGGTLEATGGGTVFRHIALHTDSTAMMRFSGARFRATRNGTKLFRMEFGAATFEDCEWFTDEGVSDVVGLNAFRQAAVSIVGGAFRLPGPNSRGLLLGASEPALPEVRLEGTLFEDCDTGVDVVSTSEAVVTSRVVLQAVRFLRGGRALRSRSQSSGTGGAGGVLPELRNVLFDGPRFIVEVLSPRVFLLPDTLAGRPESHSSRGIHLLGALSDPVSGTIRNLTHRYTLSDGLQVNPGQQLVIEPGVVIGFERGGIVVQGRLVAEGTARRPIVLSDDDGTSGSWSVRFEGRGAHASILRDVEIRRTTVTVDGADLLLTRCSIAESRGHGLVAANGATVRLEACQLVANGGDGLRAESGASILARASTLLGNVGNGVANGNPGFSPIVDAAKCYWGNDLGPLDDSDDRASGGDFNPFARGQRVTDGVRYRPPVSLGPGLTGSLRVVGGANQTAPIGSELPEPLEVELRDANDATLAGVEVHFVVVRGDAEWIGDQPIRTGDDGRARGRLRLGLTPGPLAVSVTARDLAAPLGLILGSTDELVTPAEGKLAAEPVTLALVRSGPPDRRGDIDGDGAIRISDAAILRAELSGRVLPESALTAHVAASGDIDGDGDHDERDLRLLLGYLAGIVPGKE